MNMSDEPIADHADRFNDGKRQWSLLDFSLMEDMVRVMEYGTRKYARDNWRKGLPVQQIFDSLMRHMTAFMLGEDNDPETGLSHIAHAQCNLMFLMHTVKNRTDLDDRLTKEEDEEDKGPWYVWLCYKRPISKQELDEAGQFPRRPYMDFPTKEEAQAWLDQARQK